MARNVQRNSDMISDDAVRPRLLMLALKLRPRDVKAAAGVSSVEVTQVLTGQARLTPERVKPVAQLIAKRAAALLGERVEK